MKASAMSREKHQVYYMWERYVGIFGDDIQTKGKFVPVLN
jgi:hypothetical protein